ncbi:sensor domain-containing diguanylate cyclase [Achromobacter sp. UMC46]|uniref:sensor domain-containing diguanylate cyclase n=1 Tax=Achromobacter sp. UMC46 TaxID=1862319 RepID=UPI0021065DF1|nr:sensor domain-containing diguanylate cyclase [Achromobacter sp. UMC46]MBB1593540.1 diguanylate cyclase [Achromobacter sp. UMC46]
MLQLIVGLSVFSGTVAFANALFAAYHVQKEQLVATTLEANRAYAVKLAEVVDLYIGALQQQLTASASRVASMMDKPAAMDEEVLRVAEQSDGVIAAAVVDAKGDIVAYASQLPGTEKQGRTTSGIDLRGAAQERNVTPPYLSSQGLWTVALTEPVKDAQGTYQGFVGAAVYLQHNTELDKLLEEHFYRDGSYVYVVGSDGKIIYHREPRWIGTNQSQNPAIQALQRGESGTMPITNSLGVDMLAGYARMQRGGWGVIVQRPLAATLEPLHGLMWRIFWYSVPAALVMLLAVSAMGYWIARPLAILAGAMKSGDGAQAAPLIQSVQANYFEAEQLREAVSFTMALHEQQIGKLNAETMTDPMTRLLNRRGVSSEISRLLSTRQPFAVLALDLDHFKRINDTFGHAAGDQVLVALADLMRDSIRTEDAGCRVGGEEFLVLMPGASSEAARGVAERIRQATESHRMPGGVGHVTVSIGTARWPDDGDDPGAVLKCADQALYQAKASGRNKVVVWGA